MSVGKRGAAGAALIARRRQHIIPAKPSTARKSAAAVTPRPMTVPLRGFWSKETSVDSELEPPVADREAPLLGLPDDAGPAVHVEFENMA